MNAFLLSVALVLRIVAAEAPAPALAAQAALEAPNTAVAAATAPETAAAPVSAPGAAAAAATGDAPSVEAANE